MSITIPLPSPPSSFLIGSILRPYKAFISNNVREIVPPSER